MNPSEKRRKRLLEETRRLYSDRREPPAVHPRYGAVYGRLYGEDEEYHGGTLGIRTVICALMFAAFVTMDRQDFTVFRMDSGRIAQEITADMELVRPGNLHWPSENL